MNTKRRGALYCCCIGHSIVIVADAAYWSFVLIGNSYNSSKTVLEVEPLCKRGYSQLFDKTTSNLRLNLWSQNTNIDTIEKTPLSECFHPTFTLQHHNTQKARRGKSGLMFFLTAQMRVIMMNLCNYEYVFDPYSDPSSKRTTRMVTIWPVHLIVKACSNGTQ